MIVFPTEQAVGLNRRQIGDVIVTVLNDGYLDLSFSLLDGISPPGAEEMMQAVHRPPQARLSVGAYVVQDGRKTVLIDTGAGGFNGWGGRLRSAFLAANIEPDDIDAVLLTHAHPDHIGGLAAAGETPVFKNAELILSQHEYEFWTDEKYSFGIPDNAPPKFMLARNALAAYRARMTLVTAGEVLPGIEFVPLPGHTP